MFSEKRELIPNVSFFAIKPPMVESTIAELPIKTFLVDSLIKFYTELDRTINSNEAFDFGEWFSESGLLSIFINGMIRNDQGYEVSAIQEYCIRKRKCGNPGRCDALLKYKEDVFLIEAKLARLNDPEKTEEESIVQLKNYYESEEQFFKRYKRTFLMTLFFTVKKRIINIDLTDSGQHCLEENHFFSSASLNGEDDYNGLIVKGSVREIK